MYVRTQIIRGGGRFPLHYWEMNSVWARANTPTLGPRASACLELEGEVCVEVEKRNSARIRGMYIGSGWILDCQANECVYILLPGFDHIILLPPPGRTYTSRGGRRGRMHLDSTARVNLNYPLKGCTPTFHTNISFRTIFPAIGAP